MPSGLSLSFMEVDGISHHKVESRLGVQSPNVATNVNYQHPVGSRTLLFITNADGFGGTEKHLLELVKRLPRSEAQGLILQLGADVYRDHLEANEALRVEVRSEKFLSPWDWFRFFRKNRRNIVVFVNSWVRSFPWYSSVAAYLAGVSRCFAIQHLIAPPLPKVQGRSLHSLLRLLFGGRTRTRLVSSVSSLFYDATICVSNAVRDRLITDYRFPPSKTMTIHNGVSVSEFVPSRDNRASVRARLGFSADDFLLVCVARLSEVKGLDILLLTMAQLLRQGLCCKCVIVGDGPLRKPLSEQAEALGLNGHVFFEGFQDDVRPFLQAADAFVLTSHREGLPLSILEAMACGLPCVVTNVGGNAEAVHHLVHGLIVAPGSVDQVADAISFLVTHPRERDEMSKMAQASIRKAYDVEIQMAEIKRVILN